MWAAVNPTTNQQRNTKRPNTPANSIYEQLTNVDDMIMLPWLCVLLHKSCDSLNQLSSWNLFLIDNPVLLSHFPCLTNEKAVIWAHTAVNHSNAGGDHFNFMKSEGKSVRQRFLQHIFCGIAKWNDIQELVLKVYFETILGICTS